ncbi:MAG: carbohydrate ABC transporter permease [Candidatus Infernicultor aquiphilus]|uniref:sn-glycerol-3-phosphate transport system permease protein UgpE n=1 Tax=Candidatus Infernicultor aquiphilus TaxID=1805029 RepID=A0A1J5GZG2_9BACT|nr:carbohydrate ABC transporter permease [bacterium]OIP72280.1 MAG: glycerol-3-phosphate ABC transporter permease [Candidatus Atribacteria bacterium CG2_30_33_13]PIU25792.1 MAG: carbohydrate ABC transporter permease [Candidatus Atribacteria bacterium CG08_land_8_20_14_0_20_33_29]PIW11693.1 MAG: carbohydrate ABC transporter permease [Candidatus Atribacteria bacterium CG17_big_fil_post_rev_8_21_14_2_50_34_11]PIX34038.1 MAG: carbohydrate ABC transporter permease [Candidatus Atribacteria bacterium 
MKISTQKRTDIIISETILIIVSLVFILPLILALTMSIQPPYAVFSFPPKILPRGFHLQNYITAFQRVPFFRLFLNSAVVAVMITLGKLVTGALAGYAFANFNFFGKKFSFAFLFATLFLPAEIIMIVPLFSLMVKFGWVNTYWALTIPFMASATNTFLLRQHFLMIPKELEDSAKIDGAGPMVYFIKILLPLSKSMLGGVSIINFIYAWNLYLWPLIVTMEDKMKTVQIGVKMLIDSEAASDWGVIMAGTVSAVVPTLIVFFVLQSIFVKSLTRSGIKG